MKILITIVFALMFVQVYAQDCNESNSLVSVRKRKTGNTEYVIFTLKKEITATVNVADAHPPFIMDGSGFTVRIKGCKYKEVSFKNVYWQCHVKEIWGNTYFVRQVKSLGQFEGNISYVIGYRCSAKSVSNYDYEDGDYKKVVVRIKG